MWDNRLAAAGHRLVGPGMLRQGTVMVSQRYVAAPGTASMPVSAQVPPVYLVFDTESVPDGRLLAMVRHSQEEITPQEAVERAREDARRQSAKGSDFVPMAFQYPIAACVLRVAPDFRPQALTCLDAPQFRPRRIVEQFWAGVSRYQERLGDAVRLVTFNGRGFDLPLMEMAAFRYGVAVREHFGRTPTRGAGHIDLMEWMTNSGAFRLAGGLDLLSKLLGKPGKMAIRGDRVYPLFLEGKIQAINDYCMFDTLDTYFVFLRTRVLSGELSLEDEHRAVLCAKEWLGQQVDSHPALQTYLENWGDWQPWP
jgi:predicted PolB exonuclease-like 3'-5' exonuclease